MATITLLSRTALLAKTVIAGSVLFLGAVTAQAATTYGFERVTYNNTEDLSGQLSISIWDYAEANSHFGLSLDADQVLFTVQNAVGIASSVSEVYFDDGLLGPSTVANNLGGYTEFTGGGASPGNLPGGNTIGFVATQEFSADAQGNPSRGVDAGDDVLGVILGLGSFADTAAVVQAANAGTLRFGYHIRAIGVEGDSDSYVNTVVPAPAAVWLFGSALIGLAEVTRRRRV